MVIYPILLLLNVLLFLIFVSYSDLKTSLVDTRVIGFFIGVSFILHILYALLTRTYFYLVYAIIGSIVFLIFGYGLYFLSMWGEGDVLVLGALIFQFPYPFFMPLRYIFFNKVLYYWYVLFFNVSIAGIVYSLSYAFVFSLRNRDFYKKYLSCIDRKTIIYVFLISFIVSLVSYFFGFQTITICAIFIGSFLFYFLFLFAKLSDEILFTKKIPLRDVKEGDTVIGSFPKAGFEGKRLDAISKQTINKLIVMYGEDKVVEVKDMVRFIPSFLLGFLITLLFGDWFMAFLL